MVLIYNKPDIFTSIKNKGGLSKMAKLYCRYGAMGSSKTANALMVRYNYLERGQKVIMLKPQKEKRDGEKVIRSRIGLEAECMFVEEFEELVKNNWSRRLSIQNDDTGCLTDDQIERVYEETDDYTEISAVIVDEAQFLSKEQIDFLSDIVDYYNIPVICYLLRTDFQGNFFEGSKRLMELADVIEEVPTVCWCGRRAQFNARVHDGKIVREGEQFMLGANDDYVSLCRKHFKEGTIHP